MANSSLDPHVIFDRLDAADAAGNLDRLVDVAPKFTEPLSCTKPLNLFMLISADFRVGWFSTATLTFAQ